MTESYGNRDPAHGLAPNAPAVEFNGVRVRIGGLEAVKSVRFSCHPAEVTVVVGPNGSGKTTLLNVLSGFVAPTEGELRIWGRSVNRFSPSEVRRCAGGISRSFQKPIIIGALSALDNVLVGRRVRGEGLVGLLRAVVSRSPNDTILKNEARQILEEMAFIPRENVTGADLSTGQRRKTDVARALFAHSAIVLLDEPLANVDRRGARGIVALIRKAAEGGRTVIVVEHRLHLIQDLADRLVRLETN